VVVTTVAAVVDTAAEAAVDTSQTEYFNTQF